MRERYLNGIDRLGQCSEYIEGDRLALYTNCTGLNRYFESSDQLLHADFDLKVLIAGEGGIRGEYLPGQAFEDKRDPLTSLPVISIYHYGDTRLRPDVLDLFDTLVIDIQDIGSRSASTVAAMKQLIEDCAAADKAVIVFDRANPLGGLQTEGLVYMDEFRSPFACSGIPMRHGLTAGELALYFNSKLPEPAEMEVVPVTGWTRNMLFPEFGRSWVATSTQMPHFSTALLYPGMHLFDGTTISVGHGTGLPYEIIGAPFIDALQTSSVLNAKNLSGVYFRPIYFRPSAGRFVGQSCQGVQVQVVDPYIVQPVQIALSLIDRLTHDAGSDFRFLAPSETGTARPLIDLIAGNDWVRQESMNTREVLETGRDYVAQQRKEFEKILIYDAE